MTVLLYLCGALSLIFSATCFIPVPGVVFLGFPLTLLFSLFYLYSVRRLLGGTARKPLSIVRKSLEYLPFVLLIGFIIRRSGAADGSFALDLFSVMVWLLIFGLSAFILYRLSDKRVARYLPSIAKPSSKPKSALFQAVEWIDALLQAACLVLLINLFIFQLYAIPSESMVPEFMIGDRVIVLKTPSGPKFPLSSIGIPRMRSYKRGDIVVFNNPHYNDTKEARVRTFTSQLIYMLTFTKVNINRDESGHIKADPLVKRITGEPGEKLMMVDGVLYARKAGDSGFAPVADDAVWAAWNIATLPRSELAMVKRVPLSLDEFALVESIESTRTNVDLALAASEARSLVSRFEAIKPTADTVREAPDLYPHANREVLELFQENADITRVLLTTNGGLAWFREFMTAWIDVTERPNLYEQEAMKLNLLLKLDFGKLMVRNAELIKANRTSAQFAEDAERKMILSEAQNYIAYVGIQDQRNMSEFPSDPDEYIPDNCFFMMGDNRFNSLDMRHSYEMRLVSIDKADPYSLVYSSNLAPRWVPVERILGSAYFRFWPLHRAGVPE